MILRACTDELTADCSFGFRRSAFKGFAPKVTLMVKLNGRSIPIDFSVNSTRPLYNAALLTECGQIEPRAKELILLIRRWAKSRGICFAAKGHLPPYAWSLLVIYFLQVWDGAGPPLLPQITAFKKSSALLRKQQKEQSSVAGAVTTSQTAVSIAHLFKCFFIFYMKNFDWHNEAVSVRSGKRKPPPLSLPLHIVTLKNGNSDVVPSVQDPFNPKRNLADGMTGVTLTRLREELSRAVDLCEQKAPLQEFLATWVPPERDSEL